MVSPELNGADVPTPGPWLVRGQPDEDASAEVMMLGVEPATDDRPGGWPYLIRQDRPLTPGGSLLHVAIGIQRLADARLIAGAPDLADTLFRLLTTPALARSDLDPRSASLAAAAWALLVEAAPHIEI